MDPATLKMVLQITQTLARSRMVRAVVAGLLVAGLGFGALVVFGSYAVVSQTAASMRANQTPTRVECSGGADSVGALSPSKSWKPEQLEIARAIVSVGKSHDIPERGWVIAIAVGLVETELRNLDWGDRDSVGWAQQRPSTGWGTVAQIRTPALAAAAFYGVAKHTNNPGLTDVAGWQDKPMGQVAQTIQVSAYPDRYAVRVADAQHILEHVGGGPVDTCAATGADTAAASAPLALLAAPTGQGREAARKACVKLGSHSVFTYNGHQPTMNKAWDCMAVGATGQAIADHMAANRDAYGISYIIWNRQILRDYDKPGIPAGTWGPYFDGGSSDPSRAHTNHVHTSYY